MNDFPPAKTTRKQNESPALQACSRFESKASHLVPLAFQSRAVAAVALWSLILLSVSKDKGKYFKLQNVLQCLLFEKVAKPESVFDEEGSSKESHHHKGIDGITESPLLSTKGKTSDVDGCSKSWTAERTCDKNYCYYQHQKTNQPKNSLFLHDVWCVLVRNIVSGWEFANTHVM